MYLCNILLILLSIYDPYMRVNYDVCVDYAYTDNLYFVFSCVDALFLYLVFYLYRKKEIKNLQLGIIHIINITTDLFNFEQTNILVWLFRVMIYIGIYLDSNSS